MKQNNILTEVEMGGILDLSKILGNLDEYLLYIKSVINWIDILLSLDITNIQLFSYGSAEAVLREDEVCEYNEISGINIYTVPKIIN